MRDLDDVYNEVRGDVTGRFSSAPWFKTAKNISVQIIGLGGIGSYAAYSISRFRPSSMTLIDPDIVEPVNMSGQLYSKDHVGFSKCGSLARFIHEYSSMYCNTFKNRYEETHLFIPEVVVCGLDNMEARKAVYTKFSESYDEENIFIDGRMSAEVVQIFCVENTPESKERYEKYLFADEEAWETVCSFRQTSFMGMWIGGMIGALVANYCNNITENTIKRPLPFLTEFNSACMQINIEE